MGENRMGRKPGSVVGHPMGRHTDLGVQQQPDPPGTVCPGHRALWMQWEMLIIIYQVHLMKILSPTVG